MSGALAGIGVWIGPLACKYNLETLRSLRSLRGIKASHYLGLLPRRRNAIRIPTQDSDCRERTAPHLLHIETLVLQLHFHLPLQIQVLSAIHTSPPPSIYPYPHPLTPGGVRTGRPPYPTHPLDRSALSRGPDRPQVWTPPVSQRVSAPGADQNPWTEHSCPVDGWGTVASMSGPIHGGRGSIGPCPLYNAAPM
jgi:hypothetical protein